MILVASNSDHLKQALLIFQKLLIQSNFNEPCGFRVPMQIKTCQNLFEEMRVQNIILINFDFIRYSVTLHGLPSAIPG